MEELEEETLEELLEEEETLEELLELLELETEGVAMAVTVVGVAEAEVVVSRA